MAKHTSVHYVAAQKNVCSAEDTVRQMALSARTVKLLESARVAKVRECLQDR